MPIISSILSIISTVFGALSDEKKLALTLALQQNQGLTDLLKAQASIDQTEAASGRLIDDWRDVVGWVCAAAFAWSYVICPVVTYCLLVAGHPPINFPVLNIQDMMTVLMGMLGLGSIKTWQKITQSGTNT